MIRRTILAALCFWLAGCVLKGTDSGNPGLHSPVNGDLCGGKSSESCAQANPAVLLIDQGLCGALNRCGSELRGDDCRTRAFATDVLPVHYPDAGTYVDSLAFAWAVGEGTVKTDGPGLASCLNALDAKACAQLPPGLELSPTLAALLRANPECAGIFTKE